MTIEVNETTKKQVEIKLPYYSKDSCHYWKVINENEAIGVTWSEHLLEHTEIQMVSLTVALSGKTTEITKEEFNQAFNEAMAHLLEKNKDNNNPCEAANFCSPQDSNNP